MVDSSAARKLDTYVQPFAPLNTPTRPPRSSNRVDNRQHLQKAHPSDIRHSDESNSGTLTSWTEVPRFPTIRFSICKNIGWSPAASPLCVGNFFLSWSASLRRRYSFRNLSHDLGQCPPILLS